jgi:hypothetical protein
MLLKKSIGHFTGTELEIGELQYKGSDVFDRANGTFDTGHDQYFRLSQTIV